MKTMSVPFPVLYVIHTLKEAGYEAFLVGGAVRDVLVGKDEILDWDITTNATPEEVLPLFEESFYDNSFGTVMVAPKHVTAQMGIEEDFEELDVFDITTYRTESGYTNRRHPEKVEWGETLEEDLKRRDFTINAMAAEVTKMPSEELRESWVEVTVKIVDPYEGEKDLKHELVRAVGNPLERFEEDALRMMRAIRFASQLGFQIEERTMAAIQEKAPLIEEISWERKRDELLKILASPYPADGILLLHSAGLLKFILPELLPMKGVKQGGHHIYDVWTHSIESLRECPSTNPIVRLATLLHDVGKPQTVRYQGPRGVTFYGHEVVGARMAKRIGERLRLSKKQVERLKTLVRWHMFNYDPEMTDAAIRRFIKRVGRENINDMMLLRVGDRKGGGSKATSWRLREFQQRIGENLYEPMSVKDLKIDGNDVMEILDIKPGREIGIILNQLFEEVMEESSKNSREYLGKRVRELSEELGIN